MTRKLNRVGRWTLTAYAALTAGAILGACSSNEPASPLVVKPAPEPVVSTTPTIQRMGSHWVQDQRLRVVMAELSKQNPNWPAGVPQEPESTKQGQPQDFDEVANLASALMQAADRLPEVAEKITMNEADRRGFLAEAQVLHDQAGRLSEAAKGRKIEQMQVQMTALNSTCISCHSRYRDFSGKLNSPQASVGMLGI